MRNALPYILIVLLQVACSKGPGEGGRATIQGKVYVLNYSTPPCPCSLQDQYYGQGENVYIMYGDQPGIGNSVKTAYDGSFQFPYLRPGKYKIYALSKDTTSQANSATVEVLQTVEIINKKDKITLPDIVIVK